ncbi:hypothetical protein ACFLW3_01610 [Chloroflexota bacterium]
MLEQTIEYLVSWFVYPNLLWNQLLLSIGLSTAFAAVWLTPYWTPILKKPWAWAILAGGGFLSVLAVTFIQIPLQAWTGHALLHFWSQAVLMRWLLLAGIPQMLLSGLVQEGSKLVPVIIYWRQNGKNIDPKLGLVIGAVAGLGLGVFEAVWTHNQVFASGWTLSRVQLYGPLALAVFWERFFVIAFHTAVSALAGWGLAKGWGWQFYLLASMLHGLTNYAIILLQAGIMNDVQIELFIAVIAVLVTTAALWLRWRKTTEPVELAADAAESG